MKNLEQVNNNSSVRNIKIDYLFSFMKNFDISGAIWVLYMVYRGLPLWQIGIVEGIFHVASFIFEVPSGALADLYGRKKVIIAGRICSALSALINLFAHNVFLFSIGFIISALSYNLNSGSEEALVYDSLKEAGEESRYLAVNSKINIILEVSQAMGTFIGGALAEYSFSACYITAIIIALLSLIPCFMFKEPNINNSNKEEHIPLTQHFRNSYQIIKENKEIINILIYYPLVFTFDTVVYFYGQQYFSIFGCNKIEISIILLLSGVAGCIGALTCEKIVSIFEDNTKYFASFLMAISIILISRNNLVISIIFFAVMSYANSLLYPIQSTSLNKIIPSEQRATIISVDSMIFSLAMIFFFPICGLIADLVNLHVTFLILGCIQILLITLLMKKN